MNFTNILKVVFAAGVVAGATTATVLPWAVRRVRKSVEDVRAKRAASGDSR